MGKRDKRVDAYIARSRDFAKPILTHLREVIHESCPEVEETLKWSVPHFDYKGPFAGMAAFKEHCTFGFWKGALIVQDSGSTAAMGQFGRIEKVSDLPPKAMLRKYIKAAMELNETGVKAPRAVKSRPEIPVPAYFTAALARNKKAKAAFEAFSPSHRREYLEWITEAKTEATRDKRLATAIEWMSEGKPRNWKYQR
jgi:uncharacterized protein YdeI (YjbR/CyaY-like superfamily)